MSVRGGCQAGEVSAGRGDCRVEEVFGQERFVPWGIFRTVHFLDLTSIVYLFLGYFVVFNL